MRPHRSTVRALRPAAALACVIGHVVELSPAGQALVDYPVNDAGPLPARSVLSTSEPPAPGTPVLLAFEGGDPSRPIILGLPRDGVYVAPPAAPVALETRQDLTLRTESLVLDARRRIVLRCGQGSITVEADGTVIVRGTRVVSRASGTNKIKGAAVKIN